MGKGKVIKFPEKKVDNNFKKEAEEKKKEVESRIIIRKTKDSWDSKIEGNWDISEIVKVLLEAGDIYKTRALVSVITNQVLGIIQQAGEQKKEPTN